MFSSQNSQKVDVVQVVDNIFFHAVDKGASDIHIEPTEEGTMVRYRIDGILRVVFKGDSALYEAIVARIKVMAKLETTGLPRPQEGKIIFKHQSRDVDLRVSIFPTTLQEVVVIRVLEDTKQFGDYKNLGFTDSQTEQLEKAIKKPFGLFLVTGPNGSGKSTTLFTSLKRLNVPEKSIATLEDPVERHLDLVRQTQIDPSIGLTFADGLRFLLRQDPDIIMVGEIRDKETAQIAVEAAITGHLVIATIHTNNAAGAIVRLINMEVEPYLLATSLKIVTAQRLARQICPDCKQEITPTPELLQTLNAPAGMKFFHSPGCASCENRGTKGRVGIHEVLEINNEIENLILTRPSDDQINSLAIKAGMKSLREAALEKINEGVISIEEAIRLTE